VSLPSLLVRQVPHRRTVTAGVWVLHGSAHDPEHLAGATHMVEHLTLRRCGDHDRASLARMVDRLGGEVDAWTTSELMGVTAQTTLDVLAEILELLTQAVLTPTFDRVDVDLERRIALAELELIQDDPAEQAEEAILKAAWGEHPLARSVIGSEAGLKQLQPAALRKHHGTMIRPGGLLVSVVGDVHEAEVAGLLEQLPLASPPSALVLEPLSWRGEHLVIQRPGVDQVHMRLALPAMAASDPAVPRLAVLNRLLGVGASSRLFQRLREEEGLTYDIWSSLCLRSVGGLLEVGWTCSPEAFPDVSRLVDEELERLPSSLEAEEVDVAREAMARCLQMDADSTAGLCSMDVAEVLECSRRFDLERAIGEITAVTLDDVRRLATEMLAQPRASALCGPEGVAARVA